MSLRSRSSFTRRIAIAAAAGALAGAVAVTPAAASDDWGDDPGVSTFGAGGDGSFGGDGFGGGRGGGDGFGGGDGRHDHGRYKGVVTARTLALRSAPNRGSQVIRYAHRGEVVHIYCKAPGQKVNGNPLWYLLTDGTWAWGAARYIDNIGPAPRWC